MKPDHFVEADGLRAYAALWVAIGHALQFAGVSASNPILRILVDGEQAVAVFIMLSGFVITHLLLTKQEAYGPYILRRFMRLAPAFFVCCVAGYFLAEGFWRFTDATAWGQGTPETLSRELLFRQVTENPVPHVLAHLTMMHGLIPAQLLPGADRTFLVPGWSISLEWQFYLVAPFVIAAIRRPVWLAVLAVLMLVAFQLHTRGMFGQFGKPSTLMASSAVFAIGIGSRLLLPRLRALGYSPLGWTAAVMVLAWIFVRPSLGVTIWVGFICYLGGAKVGWTGRTFEWIFANPVTRFLGKISYSIYLTHMLIMIALGMAAMQLTPDLSKGVVLGWMVLAIVLSIPVSAILYETVERPGIRLGVRLARAMSSRDKRDTASA